MPEKIYDAMYKPEWKDKTTDQKADMLKSCFKEVGDDINALRQQVANLEQQVLLLCNQKRQGKDDSSS
jgi:hypothetical protein